MQLVDFYLSKPKGLSFRPPLPLRGMKLLGGADHSVDSLQQRGGIFYPAQGFQTSADNAGLLSSGHKPRILLCQVVLFHGGRTALDIRATVNIVDTQAVTVLVMECVGCGWHTVNRVRLTDTSCS